jgi:hypothetical protein
LVRTAVVRYAPTDLLVLGSRALQWVETELVFVGGATDAPLLLLGKLLHLLLT